MIKQPLPPSTMHEQMPCACGADAIVFESSEEEGMTQFTWGQGKAQLKAVRYQD
tara:strand:+ start:2449 stop:2610 length:162 start_codon:yes stop_codon:yes gene_type:complete